MVGDVPSERTAERKTRVPRQCHQFTNQEILLNEEFLQELLSSRDQDAHQSVDGPPRRRRVQLFEDDVPCAAELQVAARALRFEEGAQHNVAFVHLFVAERRHGLRDQIVRNGQSETLHESSDAQQGVVEFFRDQQAALRSVFFISPVRAELVQRQ